jgi:hypothetical protein
MRLKACISIGLLAVIPGLAENASGLISGPVLGYVAKSDGVRALTGIPGAAYFGSALQFDGLEVAAVSSVSSYAILLTADRTSVRVIALPSLESAGVFTGFGSAVNKVRLSPGGTAAALVREGSIDVLSGLPKQARLSRTVEAPAGMVATAISDDGEALAIFDGNTISLFDHGEQKQLASARAVRDLRFRKGSRDFVYIDGDSVMVASAEGVKAIVSAADNLSLPRSALLSRDGSILLVADAGSEELLIAQTSGGISERVKLPCSPAELISMNDSALLLRCETGSQLHLIQLMPTGTRVAFVPEPAE